MAKAKADKVKKVAIKGKKAVKKAVEEVVEKTGRQSIVDDQGFQDQVVALREEGKKWSEIAEETGVSSGRCQMAFMKASAGSEEATPKAVVAARSKELQSWGKIAARFSITEGKARALFVEGGGDLDAPNIRGGRKRNEDVGAKAEKASKAAKAKPAKRGKKAKFVITPEMDDDAIIAAADGRKISWTQARTGNEATAQVKPGSVSVKAGKGDKRILSFNDGNKSRSIDVNSITKVA